VVRGARHDFGSIQYLEKLLNISIYLGYVVQGAKHNHGSVSYLGKWDEVLVYQKYVVQETMLN